MDCGQYSIRRCNEPPYFGAFYSEMGWGGEHYGGCKGRRTLKRRYFCLPVEIGFARGTVLVRCTSPSDIKLRAPGGLVYAGAGNDVP